MPLVKKQQGMNLVSGDYHLKMAEEQENMENADVKAGGVEEQQSSGQASGGAVCGKQSEQSSGAKPDGFVSSDSGFQSDFAPSETNPEVIGTPLETACGVTDAEQTQSNSTEQENWNGAVSSAASGKEPKIASEFVVPDGDCPLVQSVAAKQHTEQAAESEVLSDSLPAGTPQTAARQRSEVTQSTPKLDRNHSKIKNLQPQTAPAQETAAGKLTAAEKSTGGEKSTEAEKSTSAEKSTAAEKSTGASKSAEAEKSTGDGAAQKKKKKKQKASASKKETEKTEANKKAIAEAKTCQSKDNSQQAETPQQLDEQLWKEVDWCVEQLELGLKTQKPTAKQAAEALQAIRTLRSDKAPLVKKRQLMRAMFGDYRKKMEEDWCRELKLMEAAVKSARVMEMQRDTCKRSCRFIRKRSGACRASQGSTGSPGTLHTGLFKFVAPQEEFRFNFLEESLLD